MERIKNILMVITVMLLTAHGVSAQDWVLDFDKAQELAQTEDKTIVLVFSGSDWCGPCIKLERSIWTTDEFNAYAKGNYVMARADFPRRNANALSEVQQEKNNKLAEMYNPKGYFPLVVILDKNLTVLGKTGYKKMTPAEYVEHINSFVE